MIQMEVTQEKKGGFILLNILIEFWKATSRIQDHIKSAGIDQHTRGVSRRSIEPTVGTQKNKFHHKDLSVVYNVSIK